MTAAATTTSTIRITVRRLIPPDPSALIGGRVFWRPRSQPDHKQDKAGDDRDGDDAHDQRHRVDAA